MLFYPFQIEKSIGEKINFFIQFKLHLPYLVNEKFNINTKWRELDKGIISNTQDIMIKGSKEFFFNRKNSRDTPVSIQWSYCS
jgi:hypothetical protein